MLYVRARDKNLIIILNVIRIAIYIYIMYLDTQFIIDSIMPRSGGLHKVIDLNLENYAPTYGGKDIHNSKKCIYNFY